METPWTFSRVCREWRAVCLGTPRLWCIIDLNLQALSERDHSCNNYAAYVSILSTVLERTADAPLHINLTLRCHQSRSLSHFRPIVQMVFDHCDRWASLTVSDGQRHFVAGQYHNLSRDVTHLDLSPLKSDSEKPISGSVAFGSLRSVTLQIAHDLVSSSDVQVQELVRALSSAPLLASIVFQQTDTTFQQRPGRFPVLRSTQIRHIHLLGCLLHESIPMLAGIELAHLETLRLGSCREGRRHCFHTGVDSLEMQTPKAIHMPELRDLALALEDEGYKPFCRLTIVPSLRRLELSHGSCNVDMSVIENMLERSQLRKPSIEHVSLHFFNLMDITCTKFLRRTMFVNTTTLQILGDFVTGHLFDCLASQDRTLLPNLEKLEVNISRVKSPAILPAITRAAGAGLRVLRVTLLQPESVWADELRALGSSHPELKVEVCLSDFKCSLGYMVEPAILSDLFNSANAAVWMNDRDVVNRNIEENAELLDMLFATLEKIIPKLYELEPDYWLTDELPWIMSMICEAGFIPRDDQFHFKERAARLGELWFQH
ncbi:hypothetical protein Moror_3434 [Moniliophthora roreri MCA 2997]|nr:hypothetical protein Moror_3434 [Moniliophthora roreri MCA 2997]